MGFDTEIVLRHTGQSEITTVDGAERIHTSARAHLLNLQADLRRQKRHLAMARFRMLPVILRVEPWVLALVASLLFGLACSLIAIVFGLGLPVVMLAFICSLVGMCIFLFLTQLDYPGEEETRAVVRQLRRVEAEDLANRMAAAVTVAITNEGIAHRLANGMRDIAASKETKLLGVDCRKLSGEEFESYLADVFGGLGYVVERTGRSGDQGVDLILTSPTLRIAVQAKCYSSPVGNGAVQEVSAGKQFYDCHHCVVVASNTFTRSARELAGKLNCQLIDCDQMDALIKGHIPLGLLHSQAR